MTYEEFKMQCMLLGYKLDVGDWTRVSVYMGVKIINIPNAFPSPVRMMSMRFHGTGSTNVDCYEDVITQLNIYIDMADSL